MSEATYPAELKYHEDHDWARLDGDVATFGITWYAQDALGDVVAYLPPEVGFVMTAGKPYGELESVKAVSDLIAPLDGEVVEVNEKISEVPEGVNEDPYEAWLVRVKLSDPSQLDSLMDVDAYRKLIGE